MIQIPLIVLTLCVLLLSPRTGAAQMRIRPVEARAPGQDLERLPPVRPSDCPPDPPSRQFVTAVSSARCYPQTGWRTECSQPVFAASSQPDRFCGGPMLTSWQPRGMVQGPPGIAADGPVYAGYDGPGEVSPAYGGNDAPAAVASTPGCFSPGLSPAGLDEAPGSGCFDRIGAAFCREKKNICSDYCNFYSWPSLRGFALAFGAGAVMANTSIDQGFRNWYQDDVRNSGTDDVSAFFKTFGEGQIFIPAFAGLALVDLFWDDMPVLGIAGEFGDRATRAYLVGAPPMLLMQLVTGASRPGEASYDSYWRPFEDNNGVSGHAFIGAVPFLTAARMTDNLFLKSGFYILSTFTAWSRVNDDCHYLSQVCLGWWMAYVACRSVDQTEAQHRLVTLAPIASPEMTGLALVIER